MKIIELTVENVKRIKAVTIRPGDAALVEIAGKNGAGKTGVLDAMWWALSGAANVQSRPIRDGEDEASVKLDLGEIKVLRRWRRGKTQFDDDTTPIPNTGYQITTSLVVTTADGAKYPSPQAAVDKLIGTISFDPLRFAQAEPKAQAAELRRMVKLDVDLDAMAAADAADRDNRHRANAEAKRLRAQAAALPVFDAEPIDAEAIMAELASASYVNQRIANDRLERQQKEDQASTWVARADANLALRQRYVAAQEHNRQVAESRRRRTLEGGVILAEQTSQDLTARLEAREAERQGAISRAEMPVPGLGFGDDGVTMNGLPFDQASTAEQIRTSLAVAMAASPRLKVIRIKQGCYLDADGMAVVERMAAERGYQVCIERVDLSGGRAGIVIEDGEVKRDG